MLILPQQIIKYISTNLEQPYQLWVDTATYALDTYVIYKNHIYRTIVDNNQGVRPDLNTGKWLLFGVDNAYAGIDLHSHTASYLKTDADKLLPYIEFKFQSIGYDYIGFGQVHGTQLEITEYDSSGGVLKTSTHKIGSDRTCADSWYNYYYCGIPDQSDLGRGKPIDFLYGKLNPTASSIMVRIIKNSDGHASVGSMVSGKSKNIGQTQFGVNIGIIDYSKKETDEYGITTLVRRDSRETMESEIVIPAKATQIVKREIKDHLGNVVMFIAEPEKDTNYEHLIMLGYINEFEIYINNGVLTRARLFTEEVI